MCTEKTSRMKTLHHVKLKKKPKNLQIAKRSFHFSFGWDQFVCMKKTKIKKQLTRLHGMPPGDTFSLFFHFIFLFLQATLTEGFLCCPKDKLSNNLHQLSFHSEPVIFQVRIDRNKEEESSVLPLMYMTKFSPSHSSECCCISTCNTNSQITLDRQITLWIPFGGSAREINATGS